jgi:hypothetical protein
VPAVPGQDEVQGVERVIREVKEDFLAWPIGQVLPERPTLA